MQTLWPERFQSLFLTNNSSGFSSIGAPTYKLMRYCGPFRKRLDYIIAFELTRAHLVSQVMSGGLGDRQLGVIQHARGARMVHNVNLFRTLDSPFVRYKTQVVLLLGSSDVRPVGASDSHGVLTMEVELNVTGCSKIALPL